MWPPMCIAPRPPVPMRAVFQYLGVKGENMNKRELVDAVASDKDLTKTEVEGVLDQGPIEGNDRVRWE